MAGETHVLTIYGASDDLVEFEGAISEEFDVRGAWAGLLEAPNGDSLIIRAEFCKPGALDEWTLAVESTDTRTEWPIRFGERPDREGDPAIHIMIPTGTTIKELS